MNEFAIGLRKLRRQYFCKQMALASACSCSVAHISWLETGKRCPSARMLRTLQQAFAVEHAGQHEIGELLARAQADILDRYCSNGIRLQSTKLAVADSSGHSKSCNAVPA